VAERAYRLRAPYLVARDAGGRVCGVLPLLLVDAPLRSYAVTGLFGAYGRVLCDHPDVGRELIDAAWNLTEENGLSCLVHKGLGLDEPALDGASFQCLDRWVTATLSLEGGEESVWGRLRSEIRNRIRKAQRSGFELRTGVAELPAFYDVLAENMHRKGTPIYGLRFMQELVRAFGARAEVIVLAKDGQVVSGALVLDHAGVVNVPFVSSRQSVFHLCPNNLLYWEIIQRAIRRGMSELDFGRSPRHSSNLDFKLRWGAQAVAQPFHVRARGKAPAFDQTSATVQWLVRAWRVLPRPLVDALGPAVCRRLLV